MHNCFLSKFSFWPIRFVWPISILIFMSGCSSQVQAPQMNSSKNDQSEINLEQEDQIERQCLAAWRNCLAGNKDESVKQLEKLSKQYPKSSSVLFMTGQVLERCGRKKEAIAYYEKSLHNSDFATMSLFKLAESLRTTGNTKKAITRYRQLIAIAPDFPQAHLGLAKSLRQLDANSSEAKKEINLALKLDPNNKEAGALLQH